MKNFYVKLFYILFLCLITPSFVGAYQFTNNLKIGETSSDVLELQKILNADTETQIAVSGAGSSGNETNYFGALTKQAVIRFQEKYGEEILLPNGLQFGTGFVGLATRKKLNSLSEKNNSVDINQKKVINNGQINQNTIISSPKNTKSDSFRDVNPAETSKMGSFLGGIFNKIPVQPLSSISSTLDKDTLSLFPSFSKEVKVFNVEPYQVKPGQKVVVNGTGFVENGNIFSFGNTRTGAINCQYATYCEVSVPENTSIGESVVSLENSNGNNLKQGFSAKVFVTNDPKKASVIITTIPDEINVKDLDIEIIVKGEGFSKNKNYIYTPLGEIGSYSSSDGKTITFSMKNIKDIDKLINRAKLLKVNKLPIPITINNEYGTSNMFFVNLLINQ